MNMSNSYYQEPEFEYGSGAGRRSKDEDKTPRSRRAHYSRTSRPAVMHNGIHRRRNKRFAW